MTQYKLITHGPDTWAKGTRGLLNGHATDKPRIVDARMYRDGSLGPRPRWTLGGTVDLSGVDGGFPGTVRVGPVNDTVSRFMAISTGGVEAYDETGAPTVSGTVPGANDWGIAGPWNEIDTNTYLVGHILIEVGSGAITTQSVANTLYTTFASGIFLNRPPLAVKQSGYSMVHQGRAFYWGLDLVANTNRLYYSDPYDYITFSEDGLGGTTQFFDVDGEVGGCISINSNLFIWTTSGEWFVLQGRGNPANGTLNSIGPGRIPSNWPARIDNGAVFLASDLTTIVNIGSGGQMDDISLAYLGDRKVPTFEPVIRTTTDSIVNSILVPTTQDTVRSNHNGVWTEEDLPFTISTVNSELIANEGAALELFIENPSGSDFDVYYRESMLDAPQAGSAFESPVSKLTLPRVVVPGAQLRIRRVVVDVRTYDTTDPAPTLSVEVRDGDNNTLPMITGPGDTPFAGILDEEATYEIVATMDPPNFTHFSDIEIDFTGLVIERVYVEMELNGDEPVLWP